LHDVCFPKRFWVTNNIVKYDCKTNPSVWLEDYRLTCRVGGVDDDLFMIQFLPIYLADTSRAWLDHLLRNSVDCWEDIKEIFTGNFHGMYMRPDNPLDLKGCQQKKGEFLWDYIWRFSRKCHELPKICDAGIISVFWFNTNYRTLVHELGYDQPKTLKELLDIATRHASGEEVIRAIFMQSSGKAALGGGRGAPTKAADKGAKRGAIFVS
jgi:hypothetical protein